MSRRRRWMWWCSARFWPRSWRLREDFGFSVIFITHDLSLLLEIADQVAIMYAGRIVETATREQLYHQSRHPYTYGLLHSFPSLHGAAPQHARHPWLAARPALGAARLRVQSALLVCLRGLPDRRSGAADALPRSAGAAGGLPSLRRQLEPRRGSQPADAARTCDRWTNHRPCAA